MAIKWKKSIRKNTISTLEMYEQSCSGKFKAFGNGNKFFNDGKAGKVKENLFIV